MKQKSIIFEQPSKNSAGTPIPAANHDSNPIYVYTLPGTLPSGLADFLLSKKRSVFVAGVDHDFR